MPALICSTCGTQYPPSEAVEKLARDPQIARIRSSRRCHAFTFTFLRSFGLGRSCKGYLSPPTAIYRSASFTSREIPKRCSRSSQAFVKLLRFVDRLLKALAFGFGFVSMHVRVRPFDLA